jgi:hypothetical protein
MAGHVVDSDDHTVVGKVGRVTGGIGPGRMGEVMLSVRGGTESFLAHAADAGETLVPGSRVVVVEYYPPRTVYVSPA